jgi:TolB-like protein/Tfp pilus assembly protein PilF
MQKNIRQLAAVMFTDMVGYTALMQKDENKAKMNRDRHRKVLEKLIINYHGLIMQYYGDGTLSVFGSAIEAVECAVEIQNELQKEPKIPLRIGLHIGDIVYADDGVYGDAVNIASRIQSLSIPGGILISEKVYDDIKNHPELPAKSLGKLHLKNVKCPVGVFALMNEGLVVPSVESVESKSSRSFQSVAVLPFVNISANPENEYFSDGITEELINALTKIEGLHVTSRTSCFAFKGKSEDIRQIGSQLNVNTVLEGSVRQAGDRVRITAQLINTIDGYHMWSEVYDRKLEDIFKVQDEISRKIVSELSEKLAVSIIEKPIVKSSTQSLEAYNLYLKGLFYWNKYSADCAKKALDFYQKAIAIEQDFALAHAAISGCYVFLAAIGFMTSKTAYAKAKEFALRSLELDNNLSESHLSLAMVKFFFDWDWNGAEACFQKAIELNPGSAAVHHNYTLYLMAIGKVEQTIQVAEKAHMLDPLSLVNNNSLGNAYFYAGRHDDAIDQLEKTLELDPNFIIALNSLGWIYLDLGKIDKTLQYFKKVQKLPGHAAKRIAPLGYAHAKAGNIEETKKFLERLQKRSKIEKYLELNLDFAILYIGLKNFDKVFYHLEKAYQNHYGELVFLRLPLWREIHNDPRFKDLIEKMGFEN